MRETEKNFDRFRSWQEIFSSPEDADNQFQEYLAQYRQDQRHSLISEETVIDPETGAQRTVFHQRNGFSSVSRLPNGDVQLIFHYSDQEEHQGLITPDIGAKDHPWTLEAVRELRNQLLGLSQANSEDHNLSHAALSLSFYLKGKPATQGWEDVMLGFPETPLRIGLRIYPQGMLEEAQDLLQSLSA